MTKAVNSRLLYQLSQEYNTEEVKFLGSAGRFILSFHPRNWGLSVFSECRRRNESCLIYSSDLLHRIFDAAKQYPCCGKTNTGCCFQ